MKKCLALVTVILAVAGAGGQSIPASQSRVAGRFVAYNYGLWNTYPASISPATGSQTFTVLNSFVNLGDGRLISPYSTNAPLRIGTETVTPSAVSTCYVNDVRLGVCQITVTFTLSHTNSDKISSATFGLQEALNDAGNSGGGPVTVDSAWAGAGGTTAMVSAAIIPAGTSIEDVRNGTSSGSGTVSGQASGTIPLATATTVIGAQSHLDDGVTTPATVTSTEPIAGPSANFSGTVAAQIATLGGQALPLPITGGLALQCLESPWMPHNPKCFGAVGDGNSHPLSAKYASIAAAQVDYPSAVSAQAAATAWLLTYASGASACTDGTQIVTFSNGGGGGAVGTVTVSGGVPTGTVTLTDMGYRYTSVPTTGTIATCTGTATFTSSSTPGSTVTVRVNNGYLNVGDQLTSTNAGIPAASTVTAITGGGPLVGLGTVTLSAPLTAAVTNAQLTFYSLTEEQDLAAFQKMSSQFCPYPLVSGNNGFLWTHAPGKYMFNSTWHMNNDVVCTVHIDGGAQANSSGGVFFWNGPSSIGHDDNPMMLLSLSWSSEITNLTLAGGTTGHVPNGLELYNPPNFISTKSGGGTQVMSLTNLNRLWFGAVWGYTANHAVGIGIDFAGEDGNNDQVQLSNINMHDPTIGVFTACQQCVLLQYDGIHIFNASVAGLLINSNGITVNNTTFANDAVDIKLTGGSGYHRYGTNNPNFVYNSYYPQGANRIFLNGVGAEGSGKFLDKGNSIAFQFETHDTTLSSSGMYSSTGLGTASIGDTALTLAAITPNGGTGTVNVGDQVTGPSVAHTATSGVGGATTITVNTTSGILDGAYVTGTGIAAGARVSGAPSGLTVTLSLANTGTVSGSITFRDIAAATTVSAMTSSVVSTNVYGAAGSTLVYAVSVGSVVAGQYVMGRNIPAGTTVVSVGTPVALAINLSAPTTGEVTGTVTFYSAPPVATLSQGVGPALSNVALTFSDCNQIDASAATVASIGLYDTENSNTGSTVGCSTAFFNLGPTTNNAGIKTFHAVRTKGITCASLRFTSIDSTNAQMNIKVQDEAGGDLCDVTFGSGYGSPTVANHQFSQSGSNRNYVKSGNLSYTLSGDYNNSTDWFIDTQNGSANFKTPAHRWDWNVTGVEASPDTGSGSTLCLNKQIAAGSLTNVMCFDRTTGTVSVNGLFTFNGGKTPPAVIASGSLALATSAIASAACQTVTDGSVNSATATGVVSTDAVNFTPNGSIAAVTGYTPATTGGLTIAAYPKSGFVNFDVCNWSASPITPGAVTVNWRVSR